MQESRSGAHCSLRALQHSHTIPKQEEPPLRQRQLLTASLSLRRGRHLQVPCLGLIMLSHTPCYVQHCTKKRPLVDRSRRSLAMGGECSS